MLALAALSKELSEGGKAPVPVAAPERVWRFSLAPGTGVEVAKLLAVVLPITTGAWEASDTQSPQAMNVAAHPVSGWTLQFGGGHDTTTGTAGADNQFRIWHRRTKTAGVSGLP